MNSNPSNKDIRSKTSPSKHRKVSFTMHHNSTVNDKINVVSLGKDTLQQCTSQHSITNVRGGTFLQVETDTVIFSMSSENNGFNMNGR